MRLTRDEITLITCILLALLAGAIIKRHRDQARALVPPSALSTPAASPSPTDKEP